MTDNCVLIINWSVLLTVQEIWKTVHRHGGFTFHFLGNLIGLFLVTLLSFRSYNMAFLSSFSTMLCLTLGVSSGYSFYLVNKSRPQTAISKDRWAEWHSFWSIYFIYFYFFLLFLKFLPCFPPTFSHHFYFLPPSDFFPPVSVSSLLLPHSFPSTYSLTFLPVFAARTWWR